jgi:hypothetical protein
MSKNKKFLAPMIISLSLVIGATLLFNACKSDDVTITPSPPTAKKYQGTIWVAGHGGHLAKVQINIDPNNATDPITTVNTLPTRVNIFEANVTGNELHDVRLDGTLTGGKLYWSTYTLDQSNLLHYGVVDADGTSNPVNKTIAPAIRNGGGPTIAPTKGPFYCASAQTTTHFMPITMSNEGYFTIIPKASISTANPVQVYFNNYIGDLNYRYMHGSNSPDGTKVVMSVNIAPDNTLANGMPSGSQKSKFWLFNASDLTGMTGSGDLAAGKAIGTGDFSANDHITFRSTWTRDGKKILYAGAKRVLVLDGTTLQVLHNTEVLGLESHDIMPTADGKYAIMTLRKTYTITAADDAQDGVIQLYDVENGAIIGNAVSVCNEACHSTKKRTLCGLDGKIWSEGSAEPDYSFSNAASGGGS